MVRLLCLMAFSISYLPLTAQAAVTAWTDVTVRIYDNAGLATTERDRALQRAAAIFSSASVKIHWIVCAKTPDADAPQCHRPLANGELAIRFVRSGRTSLGPLPLGEALRDTVDGEGVLATIYVDRVRSLARDAIADATTLLARAVAHELGHLLLGTNAHGRVGLMRPAWSRDDVRRGRPADWTFSTSEIAAIQTRILRVGKVPEVTFGTH